jgi:proteic killer suppression protein
MNIAFRTSKLQRIFNSETELKTTYGPQMAAVIRKRMVFLRAANNLEQVPATRPFRRHQLSGGYKGCLAVDLKHPYRLIFRPVNDPLSVLGDGGIDLRRVTDIEIICVEDYH